MCGIAGLVCLGHETAKAGMLQRMLGMLRHRGPDGQGIYLDDAVGLGHVRLSIIDLEGGSQPMSSADGALTITFNGEIFNYVELREELARKGHVFTTKSDTEVILHCYQEKGERCVEDFNGQWAFAIWDAPKRKLFLSRDRLGVRPLFYARTSQRFVFASEIKAILGDPSVGRAIDLRGLDQLLTFWSVLAPRTIFQGVSELPPGHSMVLQDGALRIAPYWQLDLSGPDESMTADQATDLLSECLYDAVRIRLRSDVPVGAWLSGGLDSSIVTSMIKRITRGSLRTFSLGFDDAEYDESSHQRAMIRHLEVDNSGLGCHAHDIGSAFPQVIWHTEQPVVRTAPVPMFLLSRLVRDKTFKVVLTGEGADEMLGGYDLFKEAKIRRFCGAHPDSKFRSKLLRRLYPYMPGLQAQPDDYLKAFFRVGPEDLASPFFSHLPRWDLTSRLKLFYSDEVRAELQGYDATEDLRAQLPGSFSGWDPFCQAQYLESRYLLPGYLLSSQGDRVGMANGIEARHPFLDHRLVALAARIPPRLKMRVLNEKYILKRVARGLVPESIRNRHKQPYRAPDVASFYDSKRKQARFGYVDRMLSSDNVAAAGLFHPEAVQRLANKSKRGGVIGVKDGMALVAILSTQLTVSQFIHRLGGPEHGALD
ncbi:MAG: asparagine synthase (glutamine-hydrolyzing) [Deltaproteobacteria bacterium]|nr:asparagine synthase (glutamine-hydrolyzing) [Deltaproteobacteria bacterium]